MEDQLTKLQEEHDSLKSDLASTEKQLSEMKGVLESTEGQTEDLQRKCHGCALPVVDLAS